MAYKPRIKDPTQLPVQLNVRIPFYLREALIEAAAQRRVSQSDLVIEAIKKDIAAELRQAAREATAYS